MFNEHKVRVSADTKLKAAGKTIDAAERMYLSYIEAEKIPSRVKVERYSKDMQLFISALQLWKALQERSI